jgi:hypothetical protein
LYRDRRILEESDVAAFFSTMQIVLTLILPIGGFLLVSRRPSHTRRQLVTIAALGGGFGGAIVATLAAAGGASFSDALPWAIIGLVTGSVVGLLGVGAIALGRWLSREP